MSSIDEADASDQNNMTSAYERQRDQNVRRNQEVLQA